jgi:cleavage stimulation factor subunit 3
MAEEVNQNASSPEAQAAQPIPTSSLAYAPPENTTTDSSATMSAPPPASGSESPDLPRETLLSPAQDTSAPLPPRPQSNLSSSAATSNLAPPTDSAPASAPRMRGGFEVDDDEDAEEVDAGKDEVDVYDPTVGFDVDAPTPAHVQTPVDRTTQSPERDNGSTPLPVQTSGSLDGPSSSDPVIGAVPTAVTADPPIQSALPPQTRPTPSLSDVNGSVAPAISRTRLAHDVIGILEDRIKDDPRGDIEAYLELIEELKSRNKEDEVRKVYEDYLQVFPLDVSVFCPIMMQVMLTRCRLNNGVHMFAGRNNMIDMARWRAYSIGHSFKYTISSCGQCTSTTSVAGSP